MLGARSVAVVGASARPGSFGERLVTEVLRSPSAPARDLVNPRYDVVAGRPCVPSLRDVAEPVDLVLLGGQRRRGRGAAELAAARGDRSAVVFGSVVVATGAGAVAAASGWPPSPSGAGMALCGGGCMGFVAGRRRAARPRLPRARGPARRAGRTGLALRVGVLGVAAHPPPDRLDARRSPPGRSWSPRRPTTSSTRWTSRDPGGRAGARDVARPRGCGAALDRGGRAGRAGRAARGRRHAGRRRRW